MKRAVLVLTSLVAGAAYAEVPGVALDVEHDAIEATFNVAQAELGRVTLSIDGGQRLQPKTVDPDPDPIAITIVTCTAADWLDDARRRWLLAAHIGLEKQPAGSTVEVIGYDSTVRPFAWRASVRDHKLAGLSEPATAAHCDAMLDALLLSVEGLAFGPPRKLLVVIGDGRAETAFRLSASTIARRAAELKVDVRGIVLGGKATWVWRDAVPDTVENPTLGPSQLLPSIVDRIPFVHHVTFSSRTLHWNGLPHRFELYNDDKLLASSQIVLPVAEPPSAPESRGSSSVAIVVIGVGGFVATVAIALFVVRRRMRVRAVG